MNNIDNVLEHHGILGMKWGQQNGPPYPLGSDISTGSRLKNAIAKRKAAKQEKETQKKNKKKSQLMLKAKKAKAKKELQEKKKAEAREKKIEQLMKDPAKMYKYRDKFTTEEINKVLTRYEAERRLYDYSKSSLRKGKEYIDLVVGYANSIYNAYDVYNRFSNIGNKGNGNNQNSQKKASTDKKDKELDALRKEKKRLDNEFEKERLTKENKERQAQLDKKKDEEEHKRKNWKV